MIDALLGAQRGEGPKHSLPLSLSLFSDSDSLSLSFPLSHLFLLISPLCLSPSARFLSRLSISLWQCLSLSPLSLSRCRTSLSISLRLSLSLSLPPLCRPVDDVGLA